MGNYGLSYILQRQEHNKNKYNKRNKDYSRIKPHGFVISEVNPDARVYFNVGYVGFIFIIIMSKIRNLRRI